MSKAPVVESSGLTIGYKQKGKKKIIVHDLLQVRLFAGELTGLLGLNGAGKSTLVRTLCGFQLPLRGEIHVNNRLLSDYTQSELSRMIGVVLTEKPYAGGMTVNEIVSLGRYPYTGFIGSLKAEDKRIVAESLEAVEMSDKSNRSISVLSDGERQKTMIAKVLAQQCPIILLDEPTAFLDVTSRIETMSLLRRLAVEQSKTILLSTHDLGLAIQMCDRLWLLEKKRYMECGTPEDLILNGIFETYFNKKGITFDTSTGKLTTEKPTFAITVEGDSNTAYWVGNALIRNGFKPVSGNESHYRIYCHSSKHFSFFISEIAEAILIRSIAELVTMIKELQKPNQTFFSSDQ